MTQGLPALLLSRRFAPFFTAQFLGAFNDNLFKQAIVALVTFGLGLSAAEASLYNNLAAGLFILPFLLFSAIAGQLADRYPKPAVALAVKVAEIGIMVLAAAGFALHAVPLLLAALFLMGIHSALFGPVKYGLLPELLPREALTGANALTAAGTFIAIILGYIGGVLLVTELGAGWHTGLWLGGVALAGLVAALLLPRLPAAAPGRALDWHPWREFRSALAFTRDQPAARAAVPGISMFWLLGAAYMTQLPVLARDVVQGSPDDYVWMLAAFSVGIGAGALGCGVLARQRVEPLFVPAGALLMLAAGSVLAWLCTQAAPPLPAVLALLALTGIGGGFYIVPLNTLLQVASPAGSRARVIAANNLLNALYMVLAAVLGIVLLGMLGWSLAAFFALLLALFLLNMLWLARLFPDMHRRLLARLAPQQRVEGAHLLEEPAELEWDGGIDAATRRRLADRLPWHAALPAGSRRLRIERLADGWRITPAAE